MKALSTEARAILKRVDKEEKVRASGKAAKELETALLVAGHEVHTESGAHAIELWTWQVFASERNVSPPKITAARASGELEDMVAAMNEKFEANGKLPWMTRAKRRR